MDVYKIGIAISMQNGVSSVLKTIQADLLGLNSHVLKVSENFGRLKLAIAGAATAFVGVGILKGLNDLAKAGEKYTHQLALMRDAGMSALEIQQSIAAANKVSSEVMTSTPTENLETIRELRLALASADVRPGGKADPAQATQEAMRVLPTVQKITGILGSVLSKNGQTYDAKGTAFELTKAAEMVGATQDPARFAGLMEGWTKAIVAAGGMITGSDILKNIKYARGSALSMSDDFLTTTLMSLLQEMKTGKGAGSGGGAGNPLASMFAEIVGGQISNKAVDALKKLGMIDERKVHFTKTGRVKSLDPGAIIGSDVYATNPFGFVRDVLEPHLKKYTNFLDKDAKGNLLHPAELRATLAAIFPNRTAQQIAGMMLQQQNRIAGDRALTGSAKGVGGYDEMKRRDPKMVGDELDAQIRRIRTDLGEALAPIRTEVLYQVSNALRYLSETIEKHPVRTKVIMAVAAAVGLLLAVFGTIAVVAAGALAIASVFSGGTVAIILAGIAAVGLALFALFDFDDLKSAYNATTNWLQSQNPGAMLRTWLTDQVASVAPAFKDSFSKMLDNMFGPLPTPPAVNGAVAPNGKVAPAPGAAVEGWADMLNRWNENVANAGKAARAWVDNLDYQFQVFAIGLRVKLVAWLKNVFATLEQATSEAGAKLSACAASIASAVGTFIAGTESSVATTMSGWLAAIKSLTQTAWSSLTDSLGTLIHNLVGWLTGLPSRIWAALTGKSPVNLGASPGETALKSTQQNSSASAVAIYMADHPGVTADAAAKVLMAKETVVPPAPANTNVVPDSRRVVNAPGLPPTAQPTGANGSQADPFHVTVTNMVSGSDIARGVTANQASQANRPAAGFTGTDPRMDIQSYLYGNVASPHY